MVIKKGAIRMKATVQFSDCQEQRVEYKTLKICKLLQSYNLE